MANKESVMVAAGNRQEKTKRFYDSTLFLVILCIAVPLFLRSVLYAPFHIPSGSMKANLLVGDYLFVSKFAYGYSRYSFPLGIDFFDGRILAEKPERGDVIVFRKPSDKKIDYIKRLVGLPGDTVQVIESMLYINGKQVPRERVDDFVETSVNGSVTRVKRYRETLPNGVAYDVLDHGPNGRLDTTEIFKVPAGHYFFMGDNRDNSQDSRVLRDVGYVAEDLLIGRAELIFFSNKSSFWNFFDWLGSFRSERFVKKIS